jgi:hypothetical protein
MKNVLLLAAVSIAALSTSLVACADSQGAFVQANVGHANTSGSSSTAYDVLGGYRWAVDAPFYLGVEGGYVNLNRVHFTSDSTYALTDITGPHTLASHTRGTSKNEAVLLGVNAKWELPGQYFITAHTGVARYRNNIHVQATGTLDGVPTEGFNDRYSYYDTNYYAGIGFGYGFSPQVSLSFNYDHYAPRYEAYGIKETVKFDMYAAAVEYRF